MTVQLIASANLGDVIPALAAANTTLAADVSVQIPAVDANLQASVDIGAGITLQAADPSQGLAAAAAAIASGELAASLAVTGPTLAASLDAAATANVGLQSSLADQLALLESQLAAAVTLTAQLGSPGIRIYRYEGTLRQLGSEFRAYVEGSTPACAGMAIDGPVYAAIIVTDSPTSFVALEAVLNVGP